MSRAVILRLGRYTLIILGWMKSGTVLKIYFIPHQIKKSSHDIFQIYSSNIIDFFEHELTDNTYEMKILYNTSAEYNFGPNRKDWINFKKLENSTQTWMKFRISFPKQDLVLNSMLWRNNTCIPKHFEFEKIYKWNQFLIKFFSFWNNHSTYNEVPKSGGGSWN